MKELLYLNEKNSGGNFAMEERVTLVRNPYPLPSLEKEGRWLPGPPVIPTNVKADDWKWYKNLEPHERLYSHHTLNSTRKHCRYRVNEPPKDSLDLILSSVYVHDKDLFVPKMYVFMQPETLNKETWRVLRNEMKIYAKPPVPLGHEIKFAEVDTKSVGLGQARKKIHPSSLSLAIEGPHTDRTNPGFTRKIDGTYYGI